MHRASVRECAPPAPGARAETSVHPAVRLGVAVNLCALDVPDVPAFVAGIAHKDTPSILRERGCVHARVAPEDADVAHRYDQRGLVECGYGERPFERSGGGHLGNRGSSGVKKVSDGDRCFTPDWVF